MPSLRTHAQEANRSHRCRCNGRGGHRRHAAQEAGQVRRPDRRRAPARSGSLELHKQVRHRDHHQQLHRRASRRRGRHRRQAAALERGHEGPEGHPGGSARAFGGGGRLASRSWLPGSSTRPSSVACRTRPRRSARASPCGRPSNETSAAQRELGSPDPGGARASRSSWRTSPTWTWPRPFPAMAPPTSSSSPRR